MLYSTASSVIYIADATRKKPRVSININIAFTREFANNDKNLEENILRLGEKSLTMYSLDCCVATSGIMHEPTR